MTVKNNRSSYPLISIIIPCYNQGEYLSQTLDCILNQAYQNWECLIVNDGSTDDTETIALKYCNNDNRFIHLKKTNGGLSSARNTGLKASKGEFIQLLDSDDLIESEKLQKQSEILVKNPNIDLVYSDLRYFNSADIEKKYKSFNLTNEDWLPKLCGSKETILKRLTIGNIMACNCPLFRKSCVDKIGYFNINLFNHEDYEFWNRFAIAGFYFHFDGQTNTSALVRVHQSSMSKTSKMEIGYQIVQLKLFIDLIKYKYNITVDKNMVRNEKKKVTKLYLSKIIKKEQLWLVLNPSERIRILMIKLIPKKFRYYFLMFNLSDIMQ